MKIGFQLRWDNWLVGVVFWRWTTGIYLGPCSIWFDRNGGR